MKERIMIVSGGQTGVDRGALDFALHNGVGCGGWCPAERKSETGRIPDRYPLREVESPDDNERTRMNVHDSDITLVITMEGRMEAGTTLTIALCKLYRRPYHHLEIKEGSIPGEDRIRAIREWLFSGAGNQEKKRVLNVAGNRESTSPGISEITYLFLEKLFCEENDSG